MNYFRSMQTFHTVQNRNPQMKRLVFYIRWFGVFALRLDARLVLRHAISVPHGLTTVNLTGLYYVSARLELIVDRTQ